MKKNDILNFDLHLEDHIFKLHADLSTKCFAHNPYVDFYVCDPKRRHIHKASVRDRVLHQAIFRVLYQRWDEHFIFDSYSSRNNKGTHAGVARLQDACRKVTKNWKKLAYTLKCDVRKFFDSIDHRILKALIYKKIIDPDARWLIDSIFKSFEKNPGKGLPLGNVTSQLFANVYLNELDQFVKHQVNTKHYFRYCDDFVIVHTQRSYLEEVVQKLKRFLKDHLLLELHPMKVEIRKVSQGIDFLGYVSLPYTQIVRTKTRRRILRKVNKARLDLHQAAIDQATFRSTIASYKGVASHGRNKRIMAKLKTL